MKNQVNLNQKFDAAIKAGNVDGAAALLLADAKARSKAKKVSLSEAFEITCGWMGYDSGNNAEASTRHTTDGQAAIKKAEAKIKGGKAPKK